MTNGTIPVSAERAFVVLIVAQVAHSIEEYVFRLFDVFAPARLVSSLISDNLAVGFAVANAIVVLFVVWCYIARVRTNHPSARGFAWFCVGLESANGVGHTVVALARGGYFPGVRDGAAVDGHRDLSGVEAVNKTARCPRGLIAFFA